MSDKLAKGLEELLSMLVDTLKEGGQFVAEQTPLVVQEFLNWAIVKAGLGLLLGMILTIVGVLAVKKLLTTWQDPGTPYWKKRSYGDPEVTGLGGVYMIIGTILGFAGTLVTCINIYNLTYVIVAPRVYLIEQISNFL